MYYSIYIFENIIYKYILTIGQTIIVLDNRY